MEKSIGFISTSPNTAYNQEIDAYKKYQTEKKKLKKGETLEYSEAAKAGKKHLDDQDKLQAAELAAEKKYQKELEKYNKGGKKGKKPKKPKILKDKAAREKTGATQEQTPFVQSIAAVTSGLDTLYDTATKVFGTIKEAFNEAFPKDPAAKSLILTLAEGFKTLATWLQPSAQQLEAFKKGMVGFFTVVKLVATVISNVFQAIPVIIQVVIGVFQLLGAVFKPVIDLATQLASSFLGMFKGAGEGVDVVKMVGDALTWLRENGLGALLDMINNATKAITEFWENLGDGSGGNLFEGFDPFGAMLEKLKGFGSTMSDFFRNAWEWAKGIYQSIKDAMGQFGSGAGGFFDGIGEVIRNIGTELPKLLNGMKNGISDFFKGFDWSTLLAGLSSGAFLAITVKAVRGILDVFKTLDNVNNFVDELKSGTIDALTAFTGALDRFQNETKSDVIMKISKSLMIFAIAIGILAGAFWLMSQVDFENTGSAVIGLVASMAVMVTGLKAMSKIAGSDAVTKMPAIAFALLLLGASLMMLGKAAQSFGSIKPDRLIPAMIAMTGGLLMMVAALKMMEEMDPKKIILGAIGINILAGAMVVMAGAVALLGMMPIDMLVQGGIALAGLLLLVTLFAAVPSDKVLQAGIAVGILAPALLLMVGAIAILGNMDIATLVQGGIAIGVMIAGLVIAVNALKGAEGGAAALMGMAVALAILIIPIKTFASMDSGALAQGIGATIVMLIGLVGAANMMQKAVPGAAAMITMAIAIGILAAAVWVLAQIPGDQLLNAFLAIAGGLAVLLAAAAIASLGPVTAGLFILAGAVLAMGLAVALAGAGILMFSLGLAGLGVAAQAAIPGLQAFAAACVEMAPQLLAMVGLAVALAALAVAVAALGVAFILLGTGLIAVGAGMALLAAFGGIGAIAVLAIWKALEPLVWSIPQISLLGGAFLALGAGLLALGAGLALTGAGLAVVAIGMGLMIAAGFGTAAAIDSVRAALERFTPITGQLVPLAGGLTDFANAAMSLKNSLMGINYALSSAQSGFSTFSTSVSIVTTAFDQIPVAVSRTTSITATQLNMLVMTFRTSAVVLAATVRQLGAAVQNGSVSLNQAMIKMSADVAAFGTRLTGTTPKIVAAIVVMISTLTSAMKSRLSAMGSSVSSSAVSVGNNVLNGFIRGVQDPGNRIGAAARNMAQKFINAMKAEFQIKSPSKVMEELGKYVKEGFYKGLTGFEEEPVHRVIEAVNNMKDELKKAIDVANDDIKSYKDKVKELSKKKKKSSKDKKDLAAAKNDLKAAEAVKKKSQAAMKQLDGALKDQQDQLMKVSDQYDEVVDKLKDAQSALADAEKEMADAAKSYTEQFSKLPEFPDEGDLVNTYLDNIQEQIDATMKFAESLAYLRSIGLDDKTYKKLLEKGTDAQPFIDALIESGQAGVDEINKLDKELEDVASALGSTAAKEMYQNGVDMARGLVEGLQAQEAELKAEMEKLGNAIVDAIKKQLGIKSPSRVFAEVGGYSMIGLMEGMQKYVPALERTSSDIGDTAIDGLRKAIDDIGETVYSDMDMTPVIRPVLDLTDVENSAKQLGNVFSSRSIDVGSVYADASNIALAARARELLIEQQREDGLGTGESVTFIQNNNSPKAISNVDLYRQTRNQLSGIKKGLPK